MIRRGGFSLIELTVVLVIAGLLALAAVPEVSVAMETATVDKGAAVLHSIWLAERMYRLEQGEFTPSVQDLVRLGVIRSSVLEGDEDFQYRIRRARPNGVEIEARRIRATGWTGSLVLDEEGRITGQTSRDGHVVQP
ncbi:MAG: type II secretion system protein [Planctomycetota bacterium]|nr:MAG: type II secretion system protein [Planctomycetota bacterium]